MTVINKFIVATSAATLVLTIGSSLIFNVHSYTNLHQAETHNHLKTTPAKLIQKESVPSGAQTLFEVQNSIISLAIPQSITVLFFLVMAGLGGFLKLKIAHAKFRHSKS
ncbi:MAG: hypothetical protein ACTMUB_09795 [cyanobacterium endosymbiont of Rhopalodia musculus]|uniref:hypothetical protein n=1 Tax=cyanobacterium endosymbiont of Epithemia clementina EcSB TaxID=3034674 RepID=UPI0024818C92|nr:hypothetical protein [cyanobacterium endosymbiont of Epithemia clementina EcSB]WGT68333.1 hypothetical protein P3F56_04580 [cyanobacterium endosymbiont of Epithemia clementina EcSB]